MVKTLLIENDEKKDIKFLKSKQINPIKRLIVYDFEKITHELISELREKKVLSAVGYEENSFGKKLLNL